MKIIYNKIIPFGHFDYITFLLWCFVKDPAELPPEKENHERIHSRQQIELLAACLLAGIVCIAATGASWWWLILAIPAPLLIYGVSWFIELLMPPYDRAYLDTCFETEAYLCQHRGKYSLQPWRHLFAWVKYIPKHYDPIKDCKSYNSDLE